MLPIAHMLSYISKNLGKMLLKQYKKVLDFDNHSDSHKFILACTDT